MNFSYLPYGILSVLKTRTFLEVMFGMEKYEFFLFPTVYTLLSKTASISVYSAGLIRTLI